jgi:undecaprenyl-diphosphatase
MNADSLLLGGLQGLTEFLPISSSGHLGFARAVFGMGEPSLEYELVLHMSTLVAVLIYFSRDIAALFFEWIYGFFNKNAHDWLGWRFGWAVAAGVFVTAPIGFFLKGYAEKASADILWLGGNFWITAIIILTSKFMNESSRAIGVRSGIFVGLIQGLAVMPGISRSGATIWAGRVAGLTREEAFRFSFLLSVPTIIGATLFDVFDSGGAEKFFLDLPDGWLTGSVAAFAFGFLSLVLLHRLVVSDRWWFFSIYCMIIGSASIILYYMGA